MRWQRSCLLPWIDSEYGLEGHRIEYCLKMRREIRTIRVGDTSRHITHLLPRGEFGMVASIAEERHIDAVVGESGERTVDSELHGEFTVGGSKWRIEFSDYGDQG